MPPLPPGSPPSPPSPPLQGPPPSGAPLPVPSRAPPPPRGGSCAAAGWPAGLTPGQSPGTGCHGDKHANRAGAGGRPGPGAQDGAEPVQSASTDGQLERGHLPGGGTRHCSGTPRPAPRPAAGASPLTQQTPNTCDIPPRLGPHEVHLLPHKPRSHAPRLFLGVPWPPKPHASPSVQSPTRCLPGVHQVSSILTGVCVSEAAVQVRRRRALCGSTAPSRS